MNASAVVALPFEGKYIRQDTSAQAVSLASALLYEAAIASFADTALQVLELGCGCGIVSIMCALARPQWEIQGLDIQPQLIRLATENANSCALNLHFSLADLRQHQGQYDLILANPPWQKLGTGLLSPQIAKNLSRVEFCCTMPQVLEAFARCLKPSATAIVIYPSHRQPEFISELNKTSLHIIDCQTQTGKKAYFCAKLRIGSRS